MIVDRVLDHPPERLESRVRQCAAIDETGEQCRVLTLHERCYRHRRQPEPIEYDGRRMSAVDVGAFRVMLADLIRQAQPHVDADLLIALSDRARELCDELLLRRDTRPPATRALAARIEALERAMEHYDAGERAAAIMARLGISRARYYRLRASLDPY
jgi:hypothetical protein